MMTHPQSSPYSTHSSLASQTDIPSASLVPMADAMTPIAANDGVMQGYDADSSPFFRRFLNQSLWLVQQRMRRTIAQLYQRIPSTVNHSWFPLLLQDELTPPLAMESSTLALALVAISSKLTQCDGPINAEENQAMLACFPLQQMSDDYCELWLAHTRQQVLADSNPARLYARQLAMLYPKAIGLQTQIAQRLLHIATADAPLNREEFIYLRDIAEEFALPITDWQAIWQQHFLANLPDMEQPLFRWWQQDAKAEWLRHAKQLQRAYHPDRWLAVNDTPYGLIAYKILCEYAARLGQLIQQQQRD